MNAIAIWDSDAVQRSIVTIGCQSPLDLGSMWRGEEKLLDDSRTISYENMFSNSCFALLYRSGAKRRDREKGGDPIVVMWCVTL